MQTDQKIILAVAANRLPFELQRTTFLPLDESQIIFVLQEAGLWLGPRPQLEDMPSFRQIIPYVVLKCGDKWVRYTRTSAGGEQRLHGRVSIGLGGHVDLPDVCMVGNSIDLRKTLDDAAEREVQEELPGVSCSSRHWAGLLVDNESAVGSVHIGVVAIWDLEYLPNGPTEDAISEAGLTSLTELIEAGPRLETWSSLLVAHFGGADARLKV